MQHAYGFFKKVHLIYLMYMETIIIETKVQVPLAKAWKDYTDPSAIMMWNVASEDWHCPRALNDLRVGGRFSSRMEAKDGSEGFDFEGTYTEVKEGELIAYVMDDGRTVTVEFSELDGVTTLTVTFEPENEYSHEYQKAGWQSILDNFKLYTEKA